MKNILVIVFIAISLNLSANAVRSWKCNDLIVTYYENNTMQVGNLVYDVVIQDDVMILVMLGKAMLIVNRGKNGSITITNADDRSDKKHFVKCY